MFEATWFPVISERVPQPNRVDYYELLEEVGMTYMDPILYLIRTDKVYFGDRFYMIPDQEKKTVSFDDFPPRSSAASCLRMVLDCLAAGDEVQIGNVKIDDAIRLPVFRVLYCLYSHSVEAKKAAQQEGIAKACFLGKYQGRKPVPFDYPRFLSLVDQVKSQGLSAKQAAGELGISTDKFYREKRKLEKGK